MVSLRILVTALLAFLADRASKIWIVEYLSLDTRFEIPVWPPLLNLQMAWNEGINFGLFASGNGTGKWLLAALALVICAVLFWWAGKQAAVRLHLLSGIVIGGALGNVWDRVQYGAVADFLNVSCCGIDNPYSFNLADVMIFLGAFGLILATGTAKNKA